MNTSLRYFDCHSILLVIANSSMPNKKLESKDLVNNKDEKRTAFLIQL